MTNNPLWYPTLFPTQGLQIRHVHIIIILHRTPFPLQKKFVAVGGGRVAETSFHCGIDGVVVEAVDGPALAAEGKDDLFEVLAVYNESTRNSWAMAYINGADSLSVTVFGNSSDILEDLYV